MVLAVQSSAGAHPALFEAEDGRRDEVDAPLSSFVVAPLKFVLHEMQPEHTHVSGWILHKVFPQP